MQTEGAFESSGCAIIVYEDEADIFFKKKSLITLAEVVKKDLEIGIRLSLKGETNPTG